MFINSRLAHLAIPQISGEQKTLSSFLLYQLLCLLRIFIFDREVDDRYICAFSRE